MIPQTQHLKLELKACYILMQKVGEVYLSIDTSNRKWAFDAIKAAQADISRIKMQLAQHAIPFTALRYKPQTHI